MKSYIKKKSPVIIIAALILFSLALLSIFKKINPLWIILPIIWIIYNLQEYIYTKKEVGA